MRIGLDIGGTKTDAVIADDAGRILHSLRLPSGFGGDAVVQTAVTAVDGLLEAAGITLHAVSSIGAGIPGAVDPRDGRVPHSVNLGLRDFPFGSTLSERLGRDVRVENDVNAAALGAFHLLGYTADDSLAYLNVGTGLAAGLVLGGRLWRGQRGVSGEIGHLPVDPAGPPCPCGQRGCLELFASGSAVARQWPTTHPLPVRALFDAAADGDSVALAVRDRLLLGVAQAARTLVLTTDVHHVVIAGGVSRLGDELMDGVRAVIAGWEQESSFVATLGVGERLQLASPDVPAAAVGAALVGAAPVESMRPVRENGDHVRG